MIMAGDWDGITGTIITEAWMKESTCINNMISSNEEITKRGTQRRYGKNIEYDTYKEASHFVGLSDHESMLKNINEMVSKIGKNLND